jgi:putative ABC transport system permease protein
MTTTNLISYHSSNGGLVVKHDTYETNPDVEVIGSNEMYFLTNNVNVEEGRAFSAADIEFNKNVAIIGNDIVKALFPFSNPIGQEINIKGIDFQVIGILEEKGAILGQSQDNQVLVPVTFFLKSFAEHWQESLEITVRAYSEEAFIPTVDEAIGVLRTLRNVQPWENNSFEIGTNESISEQFASLTQYLKFFGIFVGGLALLAAGIGIMNIMLVSVKERTREIGIRKAVGAKKRWIMFQFIIETITLSELGALLGIIIGLLLTGLFGSQLGLTLKLPIDWIIISIVFCSIIGLIFGLYPAYKAASLDPIDALRYE